MHSEANDGLMTVGEVSRRTGLSVKAIRHYEALGLLYSAGRSEGNYRLFDESALWCAQVIDTLRSLGLTIKEMDQLARAYLNRPEETIGPRLAELLDAAERRTEAHIAELAAVRGRIRRYRAQHAAALAGMRDGDLFSSDPRDGRLDSAPGVRPHHRAELDTEQDHEH